MSNEQRDAVSDIALPRAHCGCLSPSLIPLVARCQTSPYPALARCQSPP
ncbi:MAG: hypothetical protein LBK25_03985 [Treponema sp.]|nr:hypothetical protein [Treponema sp.]